jgi:hypothetical protein
MIKVQPRAKITPEFKDALLEIAKMRLTKLHENYLHLASNQRKAFMASSGLQIANLKAFVSDAGKQDTEWARFRMLPYEEFAVEEYAGRLYLKGVTKPIATEDKLDLGPYMVFVGSVDYVAGNTKDLHFVPQRDPLNGLRFWHHYAKGPREPWNDSSWSEAALRKTLTLTHYLNAQPYTCWGSFGSVATMQFTEMNTPELFRTFSIYLSRHNPQSHLVPVEYYSNNRSISLPFARPL